MRNILRRLFQDQQQKNYHKYVFIPVHACAYCIMVTAWSKHDLECGQQLKAVGGVISWFTVYALDEYGPYSLSGK